MDSANAKLFQAALVELEKGGLIPDGLHVSEEELTENTKMVLEVVQLVAAFPMDEEFVERLTKPEVVIRGIRAVFDGFFNWSKRNVNPLYKQFTGRSKAEQRKNLIRAHEILQEYTYDFANQVSIEQMRAFLEGQFLYPPNAQKLSRDELLKLVQEHFPHLFPDSSEVKEELDSAMQDEPSFLRRLSPIRNAPEAPETPEEKYEEKELPDVFRSTSHEYKLNNPPKYATMKRHVQSKGYIRGLPRKTKDMEDYWRKVVTDNGVCTEDNTDLCEPNEVCDITNYPKGVCIQPTDKKVPIGPRHVSTAKNSKHILGQMGRASRNPAAADMSIDARVPSGMTYKQMKSALNQRGLKYGLPRKSRDLEEYMNKVADASCSAEDLSRCAPNEVCDLSNYPQGVCSTPEGKAILGNRLAAIKSRAKAVMKQLNAIRSHGQAQPPIRMPPISAKNMTYSSAKKRLNRSSYKYGLPRNTMGIRDYAEALLQGRTCKVDDLSRCFENEVCDISNYPKGICTTKYEHLVDLGNRLASIKSRLKKIPRDVYDQRLGVLDFMDRGDFSMSFGGRSEPTVRFSPIPTRRTRRSATTPSAMSMAKNAKLIQKELKSNFLAIQQARTIDDLKKKLKDCEKRVAELEARLAAALRPAESPSATLADLNSAVIDALDRKEGSVPCRWGENPCMDSEVCLIDDMDQMSGVCVDQKSQDDLVNIGNGYAFKRTVSANVVGKVIASTRDAKEFRKAVKEADSVRKCTLLIDYLYSLALVMKDSSQRMNVRSFLQVVVEYTAGTIRSMKLSSGIRDELLQQLDGILLTIDSIVSAAGNTQTISRYTPDSLESALRTVFRAASDQFCEAYVATNAQAAIIADASLSVSNESSSYGAKSGKSEIIVKTDDDIFENLSEKIGSPPESPESPEEEELLIDFDDAPVGDGLVSEEKDSFTNIETPAQMQL